ncbi:hypothetical protein ACFE04_024459 [Oxalis oulophora]
MPSAATVSFRWVLQLHKDVPKAAKFYQQGLDFSLNICTLRWAELQSGPLKLALMQAPPHEDIIEKKGYSSLLSFTVTDLNSTVTKLMALGAELEGPIKHEIHGKASTNVRNPLPDHFEDLKTTHDMFFHSWGSPR